MTDSPAEHGNCRRTFLPNIFAGLSNSRMHSLHFLFLGFFELFWAFFKVFFPISLDLKPVSLGCSYEPTISHVVSPLQLKRDLSRQLRGYTPPFGLYFAEAGARRASTNTLVIEKRHRRRKKERKGEREKGK